MTADRNKIYFVLAFLLWISAYISSFAIKGGTPIAPFLYILGSVFFLLTQRPLDTAASQVPSIAEQNDETPSEDEDLDE